MAGLAILGDNNHLYLQNLENHFSFVKSKVNEFLETEVSASFSENPFVDIETIAMNAGITDIERVTPEKVYNEHARLEGTKILVNEGDSHEEQRFSIAHEIFHYLVNNGNKLPQAARSNLQHEIFREQKGTTSKDIQEATAQAYKAIGKVIYESVGKPISDRTKSIIIGKIGVAVMKVIEKHLINKKLSKKEINSFYNDIVETIERGIMDAIVEEIADYFAANLIVPTERFILWEDKSDKEIAQAFGVTEGCIRKRRNEEIEHELVFMVPQNQASSVGIEEIVAGSEGSEFVRKVIKNDPNSIQVPERIFPIVERLLLLDARDLSGVWGLVDNLTKDKKGKQSRKDHIDYQKAATG